MDPSSFLCCLRKILPEVDLLNQETQEIIQSKLDDERKVQTILSNYFEKKTAKWTHHAPQNVLKAEATYINKLFPSLSFQHVYSKLDIFKDMPNRKEIVLRLILHEKKLENGNNVPINTKRAISPINGESSWLNTVPIKKTRKMRLVLPSTITSEEIPPHMVPASYVVTTSAEPMPSDPVPKPEVLLEPELFYSNASIQLQPLHRIFELKTALTSLNKRITDLGQDTNPTTTSTVLSTVGKPATITSAAASTVTNADMAPLLNPPDANVSDEYLDNYQESDLSEFLVATSMPEMCAILPNEDKGPVETNVGLNLSRAPHIKSGPLAKNLEFPRAHKYLDHMLIEPTNSSGMDHMLLESANSSGTDHMLIEPTNSSGMDQMLIESAVSSGMDHMLIEPTNSSGMDHMLIEPTNSSGIPSDIIQTPSASSPRSLTSCPKRLIEKKGARRLNNSSAVKSTRSMSRRKGGLDTSAKKTAGCHKLTEKMDLDTDVNETTENTPFDVIKYVREITNASERTIRHHCAMLQISTYVRPSPQMLEKLVDSILTITIDSGSDSSDTEPLFPSVDYNSDTDSTELLDTNTPSNDLPDMPSSSGNTDIKKEQTVDEQLVNTLCSMFPEACPKYIRSLCGGKAMNNEVLDGLITTILNAQNQYPKRPKYEAEPEVFPENQLEILKELLPDADPDYLRMMCDKFDGKPDMVKSFINEAMERRNYPTMKEYLKRHQVSAQQKQYTTEFNVENFIKLIPDPHAFFSDPSRTLKLNTLDSHYALVFLRNHFNKLPIRTIQSVFAKNLNDISVSMRELRQITAAGKQVLKSSRKAISMPNTENIPLLQELAYYSHIKEINDYLKGLKEKEEAERQEAKERGMMQTCSCCYDEEVLPKDLFKCDEGCEFCKFCIIKNCEIRFSEGKLDFPCLMDCPSSFTLQTLQAVLSPKLFSKIAQKKALEEIKSAGIEELEQCPFCDFATIPAEGYNIFTCMNPDCMKESCRMCKEPSHIPLRCEEIEKDEDVKARVFVENKMTEALLKKCYKCGVMFFKEEGCNKMTCSCGAQMCYVCGKPVTSYKHFNGNGGDRYDLCPLYSDTNVLNKENVLKGAEQAKAEIGNVNLKHDPTADVDQHFQERSRMFPQNHLAVPPHAFEPGMMINIMRAQF